MKVDEIIGAIVGAVLFILLFSGCAPTKLVAPQSGSVEGGFNRIQTGVSKAESQRGDIVKYNTQTRSNLQKARDKEVLEVRYRDYRARHPRPTPTP